MILPGLSSKWGRKGKKKEEISDDAAIDWSALTFTLDGQEFSDTLDLFNKAEGVDPPEASREVENSINRTLPEQTADDEVARAQRKAQVAEAEAKADKAKSDNSKRDSMYRWSLRLVTSMLVVTIVFMLWYMYYAMHVKHELPELVLVTWMGTTVVEAIGIVLIIAKYLFPSIDSNSEQPSQQ